MANNGVRRHTAVKGSIMRRSRMAIVALAVLLSALVMPAQAATKEEFRAYWVDAFGPGLFSVWGYNPVAVDRFNTLYGRTGRPDPLDPQ